MLRSANSRFFPPPLVHDGIHLDFRFDSAREHYVKAINGAVTNGALTSLFTFTGSNKSYYMGAAGLLIPAVSNTPRIEYSATSVGTPLGVLIEVARTNLGLQSNDGTNAAWTKTTCSAAKTATGPDGVINSATTLTATAGNGTCLQSITSASATRAMGIWLKRRTGTGNIDLTVDNGATWSTKTITSSWARYFITQAAVTNPIYGVRIVTNGDEVDFWNAQLESASFSSSDVPNVASTVTRDAEVCSRALGSEFSATAGTVVVRGRASGGQDAASSQFVYNFDDGTLNERIGLVRPTATDTARHNVTDGGVTQANLDATFANATVFRSANAWAANDFATSFDAGTILTDAAGTLPTMTTLTLGGGAVGTLQGNCHILTFDYYPTRMPNGFLTTW